MVEFAKHLRKVHFALMLVSAVLLSASFLARSDTLTKAKQQAVDLIKESDTWDCFWLDNIAPRIMAEHGLESTIPDSLRLRVETAQGTQTVRLVIDHPCWTFQTDRYPFYEAGDPLSITDAIQMPFRRVTMIGGARTLDDWRELWNRLNTSTQLIVATDIAEGNAILAGDNLVRKTRATPFEILDSQPEKIDREMPAVVYPIRTELRDTWVEEYGAHTFSTHALVAFVMNYDEFMPSRHLAIPLKIEAIPVDVMKEFLVGKPAYWRPGKFSSTFTELLEVSGNYGDVDLDAIDRIIQSEIKRTDPDVSLFGIDFPSSQARTFGAIVILMVQLYFLTHLIRYTQRSASDQDGLAVAWVGNYTNPLGVFILWATVLVLPIMATVTLLIQVLTSSNHAIVVALAILAGFTEIAVCFVTATSLRRLHHVAHMSRKTPSLIILP